ncbi:MAG: MBOAT family O-acyltransferase [Bacilli bacterium]|jgi:alginate O-acetyltransferase complex protein AlgI|nr:MBOAT family protein [Bacilli bacterium]MDD4057240.1 MBOAT family protein [Bacilli bacterium]MDY0209073.1 MBOAT family O-acyltransferase [Bacilli bacterium]
MLFSSISFLYYFLPVVLIVYFIIPNRGKNFVLLIASLIFYFVGEPIYSILMIASSLLGYIHGLLIDKYRGTKKAKVALISSIICGVGILGFFKYADFFIANINDLFKSELGLLHIALPIGISFYTFQILSYTIDVYRGQAQVQKSFIKFATYVSLFPQLIAGPIVRYTTIEDQLSQRSSSWDNVYNGSKRFIIGLAKKVIVANTLAEVGVLFANSNDKTVVLYWLVAISFMLQIYFDFSGYSDMAIGLGRIFGFDFLENFNYPYISKSITEFWRRWHISLSTWFRDYIYIPMGGSRVNVLKWIRNILLVWLLTGFWHGAEWNFIVWGIYFGILLILEKLFIMKILKKIPAIFHHFYLLFLVLIGFVIFNANNLSTALTNIYGLFGGLDIPLINSETIYYLRNYLVIVVVAMIASTPLLSKIVTKLKEKAKGLKALQVVEPILLSLLLFIVTGCLISGSFNPFLYFRF